MAKVFIGMGVYNGEKTITQAIDSLLNQSFGDFTLSISDDASTDRTPEICLNYAKKDPRIKYYRQEKNIGLIANMKFSIDRADTELIMWADCDDMWEKDYIKACVEAIENKKVDFAGTVVADIDSYGRNLRELNEMGELSGSPGIKQITKYILQPEILGKGNLMYSIFKTNVIKELWRIYPHKIEWGSEYMFILAAISRYKVYVDKRVLFKKRVGGISSQNAIKDDKPDTVKRIVIKNPRNHMFPLGRFRGYFHGHMKALNGTPYRPLVALLLFIRLPRAIIIYLKERNIRKFLKCVIMRKK